MSLLVPRISREEARAIIAEARELSIDAVRAMMPREAPMSLSPVGGRRISDSELMTLRQAIVRDASEHGYPGRESQAADVSFDARAAITLRQHLDISPNEASGEGVWSYLTCCWLLDVALWRFGRDADERRLWGDVNRNTFRRLWWRAEILARPEDPAPFFGLGEDELVNIMERPTLARDPRLARMTMIVFAESVPTLPTGVRRMDLMRDFTKRVLRLTPFVEFRLLNDAQLRAELDVQLGRSIAALTGSPWPERVPQPCAATIVSDAVEVLDVPALDASQPLAISGQDLGSLAIDIARRTGRVTNAELREVVRGLTPEEARSVLTTLTEEGVLERRGARRGTHYVLLRGIHTRDNTLGSRVLRRLLQRRT